MGNISSSGVNGRRRHGSRRSHPPPQPPPAPPQPEISANRYVFAAATPYPNPNPPPYYQYQGYYPPPPPAMPVPLPAPYDHHHYHHHHHQPANWAGGRYPCGPMMPPPLPYVEHQKAVTIRNDVNLKKETLRLEPDEENPGRLLVSFTFDATVAGSITVIFFAKEGEDCNLTAMKENLLPPVTVEFQEGLGQKFRQPSGTGIDFSMFEELEIPKEGEVDVYPLQKLPTAIWLIPIYWKRRCCSLKGINLKSLRAKTNSVDYIFSNLEKAQLMKFPTKLSYSTKTDHSNYIV